MCENCIVLHLCTVMYNINHYVYVVCYYRYTHHFLTKEKESGSSVVTMSTKPAVADNSVCVVHTEITA